MNTFSERKEIRAHRKPWLRDSIEISMAQITTRNGQETVAVVKPLTLETLTDENMAVELPVMVSLRPDEAQQFMDELWRAGIRPSEGAGSVGQLGAVKAHLEDMRTLVFKKTPQ